LQASSWFGFKQTVSVRSSSCAHRTIHALFIALICLPALCPIFAQAPAYSLSGLRYLMQRGEYERFDWFWKRYNQHHPDSAALFEVLAERFMHQAYQNPMQPGPSVSSVPRLPRR